LVLNRIWERTNAAGHIASLAIKTPSAATAIVYLSGGNQQKVILARWLSEEVKVILLDEPTRGIDVNAKAQVYRLIGELAAVGTAVIVVSSYIPELLGICDSVAVMCRGQLGASRPVAEWDQHSILAAAIGQESSDHATT
jgi:ABC-type sugar transport system ATPase subunit